MWFVLAIVLVIAVVAFFVRGGMNRR